MEKLRNCIIDLGVKEGSLPTKTSKQQTSTDGRFQSPDQDRTSILNLADSPAFSLFLVSAEDWIWYYWTSTQVVLCNWRDWRFCLRNFRVINSVRVRKFSSAPWWKVLSWLFETRYSHDYLFVFFGNWLESDRILLYFFQGGEGGRCFGSEMGI